MSLPGTTPVKRIVVGLMPQPDKPTKQNKTIPLASCVAVGPPRHPPNKRINKATKKRINKETQEI